MKTPDWSHEVVQLPRLCSLLLEQGNAEDWVAFVETVVKIRCLTQILKTAAIENALKDN